MLSNLYLQAVDMNNQGADLLEEGNLMQAHNAFRSAMDSITRGMAKNDIQGNLSKGRGSTFEWIGVPTLPLHTAQPATFIFQHAVRIRAADVSDISDCHLESASIVWNMGLCFHIMGLTSPNSHHLQRALKFYNIVRAIRDSRSECGAADVIDLAVLNNMGQIHCEFLEYREAQLCFGLVSEHLTLLHHTGFISMVDKRDCDGFVMNILMADQPMCSAAA